MIAFILSHLWLLALIPSPILLIGFCRAFSLQTEAYTQLHKLHNQHASLRHSNDCLQKAYDAQCKLWNELADKKKPAKKTKRK